MAYTSRAATVDDAPFIVALHATDHARGFVRAAPAEARIRERHDDPRYEHRIVVSGGDPVGFYLLRSDEPWFVEAALVLTIAPRRGIGTYMLREIVRRVRRASRASTLRRDARRQHRDARAPRTRRLYVRGNLPSRDDRRLHKSRSRCVFERFEAFRKVATIR